MVVFVLLFFFKQMTAYEMLISDWSSDVCSSDLRRPPAAVGALARRRYLACAAALVIALGDALAGGCGGRSGAVEFRSVGQFQPVVAQIGRASCRERVCQNV